MAAAGDQSFFLEAKVLDEDGIDSAADSRERRLIEQLNKVDSPNFTLWPRIRSTGSSDLPTKPLRKRLTHWLAGLDPDDPSIDWTSDSAPRFQWEQDGWSIVVPIPVRPEARGRPGRRPVGITGGNVRVRHEDRSLRTAIDQKGRAYGDLDRPLVIAVNTFGMSHDEWDVMSALYGTPQLLVSRTPNSQPPTEDRALAATGAVTPAGNTIT